MASFILILVGWVIEGWIRRWIGRTKSEEAAMGEAEEPGRIFIIEHASGLVADTIPT